MAPLRLMRVMRAILLSACALLITNNQEVRAAMLSDVCEVIFDYEAYTSSNGFLGDDDDYFINYDTNPYDCRYEMYYHMAVSGGPAALCTFYPTAYRVRYDNQFFINYEYGWNMDGDLYCCSDFEINCGQAMCANENQSCDPYGCCEDLNCVSGSCQYCLEDLEPCEYAEQCCSEYCTEGFCGQGA